MLLGATGDLAARLLLPGLGRLVASGALPDLRLVGSGTHAWDDGQWRRRVADSFATAGADGPRETEVVRSARYLPADVTAEEDLRRLLAACHGQTVIFFALPPAITARAAAALARIGLPPGTRLMLEKPFGTDLASARSLNAILARLVPEEQVHRIDHFLGKSTVVNILGLRFANRIFEPVLNSEHVACVDIVFDESLGLEGRAGYYDGAGALVDMVQSHLLQVLALMAMDAPPTLDARDLRGRKAQVLRATRVWDGDPVRWSRRARYTTGEVDGRRLPGYADEAGVDATRGTETLAEMVLAVDTWRWAGVPFRLRSGKALAGRRKEAVVTFGSRPGCPPGSPGTSSPTGCGSASARTGSASTSTSTARATPSNWTRCTWWPISGPVSCRRTGRCCVARSTATRRCRCGATPLRTAGASWSRCSTRGERGRCRYRSTRPVAEAQTTPCWPLLPAG